MKTIFFGSSKYVLPTIEMLKADFGLSLVVTTEKNPTDAVPSFCNSHDIPYLSVKNLKDENVFKQIKSEEALVGVLGYFGLIVPQKLLDIFPKGIINIHPSLLPKYRGPTPVQTAILNGDEETGTTIIILDKEVDHGQILAQQKAPLSPDDTTDSLHAKLFSLGAELIKEVLPSYLSSTTKPLEQDHSMATYTTNLNKINGQFDVDNPPDKDKLERMIRAYYPWPAVWTRIRINGKEKIVKFLPGGKLQVEGGKPMSIKDFLNGYPNLKQSLQKII